MQHIGIVGARKYKDRQSVIDLIRSLPGDSVLITSSCRGVCTWASEEARVLGLEVRIYSPDLTGISDRQDMIERYYQRNRELVSACDIIHAFISREDGLKGGTRYEVLFARKLKKDLVLHWENGKVYRNYQSQLPFDHEEKDLTEGWFSFFSDTLAGVSST